MSLAAASHSCRARLLCRASLFALAAGLALSRPVLAQTEAQPMPAASVPPIAPPLDRPHPGTITLAIDATDTDRHIFTGHETIPVQGAGDHVLLFPQWLPGDHSPTGDLDKFASLVIRAGDKILPWVRDPVNVYAFHVPVPDGVASIALDFQYLSPTDAKQGRVVMTPAMLSLQWNNMLLYPAGYFSRDIMVDASATYPEGWQAFSAMDVAASNGAVIHYKPTPLNLLVDNPVLAGRYTRRETLDAGGGVPVHLDIVGDLPQDIAITPAELAVHRNLVSQARLLFASHHYAHYDFLLSLSDELGGIGLEHHASSENGVGRSYFTDWDNQRGERDLLSHEYTHSWNGKFRRPADLWQPNFNEPERDSLLWVYEGQTQYWGKILAARSGLWSKQDVLDCLALTAATYSNGIGRNWRNLQDTTNDPMVATRRPIPWRSWQRSEDYYEEGALVWLDIDTRLRALSNGTKSLDSFAAAFFGIDDGSAVVRTYTFDDIAHALSTVQPYDWAGFLRERLYAIGPDAPLDGLTRGGYRLVYTDQISPFMKSDDAIRKMVDFDFSIGLALLKDGTVRNVIWNSPAFAAGIVVGSQIIAIDGVAFDPDLLKQSIIAAKGDSAPIEVLVKSNNRYRMVRIDYHQGLRYPHLERIDAKGSASLDAIIAPRH